MVGLRCTSLFFRDIDSNYKLEREFYRTRAGWHWPRTTNAMIFPVGNMLRALRAAALGRLDSGVLGILPLHAEA